MKFNMNIFEFNFASKSRGRINLSPHPNSLPLSHSWLFFLSHFSWSTSTYELELFLITNLEWKKERYIKDIFPLFLCIFETVIWGVVNISLINWTLNAYYIFPHLTDVSLGSSWGVHLWPAGTAPWCAVKDKLPRC